LAPAKLIAHNFHNENLSPRTPYSPLPLFQLDEAIAGALHHEVRHFFLNKAPYYIMQSNLFKELS
jgi:hypothetical protein